MSNANTNDTNPNNCELILFPLLICFMYSYAIIALLDTNLTSSLVFAVSFF
jgi:hypothetical protein